MGLRRSITSLRPSRRTASVAVGTLLGVVAPWVASADHLAHAESLDSPEVAEVAELAATLEASGGADVVVVGDSITADLVDVIRSDVTAAGHGSVVYAALGARRIDVSYEWHGWRNSGVDEITSLQQAGVDPELWIVELGTNDLLPIAAGPTDPVESATNLIDTVLDTIGPDDEVAWVTVLHRDDERSSDSFNTALRRAADADPRLDLVDWSSTARGQADWFRDAVHPNEIGARALAELYVSRIEQHRSVDDEPSSDLFRPASSAFLSYR